MVADPSPAPTATQPDPRGRGASVVKRAVLGSLGVFGVALTFHLWLQFRADALYGVDGYYHIKVSHLYATGELSLFGGTFPWMAFGSYGHMRADWQTGYHILLIPFTWLGLVFGAKLSAAIFAALTPTVIHGVLRARRVPLAWAFGLGVCLTSELYLGRVHLVRPAPLVVAFLILVVHFGTAERWRALFWTTLGLVLVYTVPHNVAAVLGLMGIAFVATEARIPWRMIAAGVGALVLGILVHPGVWHWQGSFFGSEHALFGIWEQMGASVRAATDGFVTMPDGTQLAFPSPGELKPPSGDMIVYDFLPPLGAFAAALLLLAAPARKRMGAFLPATLAITGLYLYLFLGHLRFFEYWIPFAFVAVGAAFGRAVGDSLPSVRADVRALPALQRAAWGAIVALPLVFLGARGVDAVRRTASDPQRMVGSGPRYERSMTWLRENTEEGELVFHASWPQFAPMFYFNHWNRYLIGFDAFFLFQYDPDAYRAWLAAGDGGLDPQRTAAVIRRMGARWALSRRKGSLADRLREAPDVELTYEDKYFSVFRLDAPR